MTEGQQRSDGGDAQVRNLAAIADDLLGRATAAPAGRAALTLVTGAGAPLKQTMLALRSGEQMAEYDAPGAATLQVVRGRVRLSTDGERWELGQGDHAAQPIRTPSMDTEPPSKPSTGKVAGSSWRHCASTYSSGR
jgi:hypothetical protein